MFTTALPRLFGLLLACLLVLPSMPALAAIYKCKHDGQMVYSDGPCARAQQPLKTQVSVVPAFQAPDSASASRPWSLKGMLSSMGLDTTGGLIVALLFGIPLSFIVVFFLTRKAPPSTK